MGINHPFPFSNEFFKNPTGGFSLYSKFLFLLSVHPCPNLLDMLFGGRFDTVKVMTQCCSFLFPAQITLEHKRVLRNLLHLLVCEMVVHIQAPF